MRKLSLLAVVLSAIMLLLPAQAMAAEDHQSFLEPVCCWARYNACLAKHAFNQLRYQIFTGQRNSITAARSDAYWWSCECHILEEGTWQELEEIAQHLADCQNFLDNASAHLAAALICMNTSQAEIDAGFVHSQFQPKYLIIWVHVHMDHWWISWGWEGQAHNSLTAADTELDGGDEQEPDHAEASLDAAIEILEIIEDRIEEEEEED